MAEPNKPPNREGTLAELNDLALSGEVIRQPLGDDALWRVA